MNYRTDGTPVVLLLLSYVYATTCPRKIFIPIVGVGKERYTLINWSMVTCQGSTRDWNSLEDYWSCAGGLSAVNVIGTQLRDPINTGLTRWRMAV